VPTLKPGDIIITDNLGSHKGLCLSEIKHAHTGDEVRQEMA
jgi:hypothetical protein